MRLSSTAGASLVVGLLAALLTSCGDDASTVVADGSVPGGGDGPTFVRIEVGGGFVPVGHDVRQPPLAVVLDDGRTFAPGLITLQYPGPAVLPVVEGRVTDADLRRIVTAARTAGLLDDEPPDVGQPPIADAPTTTVTVVVDGVEHVTHVDALGLEEPVGAGRDTGRDADRDAGRDTGGGELLGLDPDQRAARARIRGFVDLVGGLAMDAGTEAWEPDRFRVVPIEPGPDDPDLPAGEVPWPLPDVELVPGTCTAVDGGDAEVLRRALEDATELTRWRTASGVAFQLAVRVVLPGEPGCP